MYYYFQVGKVEKRRKIKTLLKHRKTMDQPGPMFRYLLPQSSPFLVQSWNTMQWNCKKMGKNISYTSKMPRAILLSLLCIFVLILCRLPVFPATFPTCSLLPASFIVCPIYIFLADKYNTAHIEDVESLAIKCLRLSAIMIMQPPFIILLVSLKASNPELCELKRHSWEGLKRKLK